MDTLRALGAELVLVPGRALFQPRPFRPHLAPDRRGDRQARSGPTSSTISPIARRISSAPPRRSGSRWTAGSTASPAPAGTGGTIAGRRPGPQGEGRERHHRADRSAWRGALQLLCPWRAEGRGQFGRRGHRAGPDHRQSRRRADRHAVPHFGRGRAGMGAPAARARRGFASVCPRGSTSPGAVALARQLGPGKTIVTILCDTGFRYLSTLYNRGVADGEGAAGLPMARARLSARRDAASQVCLDQVEVERQAVPSTSRFSSVTFMPHV